MLPARSLHTFYAQHGLRVPRYQRSARLTFYDQPPAIAAFPTIKPRNPLRAQKSVHHLSHAAFGFYDSPFDTAVVLSMDGGGDDGCFAIYHAARANHSLVRVFRSRSISIGNAYLTLTRCMPPLRKGCLQRTQKKWLCELLSGGRGGRGGGLGSRSLCRLRLLSFGNFDFCLKEAGQGCGTSWRPLGGCCYFLEVLRPVLETGPIYRR